MKKLRIGFIGNFIPPHSTENERKYSFEKLGHTVIPFQENEVITSELISMVHKLDMLVYSHTHDPSYVIPALKEVFEMYKHMGVPTVSVHLDLWRGLKRWEDVGKEATWFVDHVFTPDDTGEWPEGINHHYMRPGVVERDCYIAEPDRKRFPHDIIFVGSRGYHDEYVWRPRLIQWLHDTYGLAFGHYGGDGIETVRGADLNTLYASSRIAIGDSCFAGKIKGYFSDRIPESTGRGAFLIHPKIEDCPHEGVAWFEPGNLEDLKYQIDYYMTHASEREDMRVKGHEWTKNNSTYTHIAEDLLDIIFKK